MAEGQLDQGHVQKQSRSGEDADAEAAAGILERVKKRVAGLRAAVVRRRGGLQAWRLTVAVIGSLVIAVGAILLVAPGPGWLVIFLGLGIWATEFAWARSLLRYVQRQVRKWTDWITRQPRWLAVTVGAAGLIAIVVLVWLFLA